MDTSTRNKRLLLVGVGTLAMISLVIFTLVGLPSNSDKTPANTTDDSTDGISYDIDSDQLSATPGTDFSDLTEKGFTTDDIDALQYGLYTYAQPQSISVQKAKVISGTAQHFTPDFRAGDSNHVYTFDIDFDGSHKVSIRFQTDQLYSRRVIVYTLGTQKQLYDSGTIDTRNI